jgi:hypothetical protein
VRTRTDDEWESLGRDGARLDLPRATRDVDIAQDVVAGRATAFGVLEDDGSGARWSDMLGPAAQAGGVAALTQEGYRDTGHELLFFRHDQSDALHFQFQMSHTWKAGTAVKFHLHVVPMSAGSGTVAFTYRYIAIGVGDEIPALATWGSASMTRDFTAADQHKSSIIPSISIDMTGLAESAIVLVSVARNPAADTYETAKVGGTAAANVAILSADLHYQIDKSGTVDEFPGAP